MARYVAFLRGINLGNRRVKGEELRACFHAAGLEQPTTFRASGNVIFDTARRLPVTKLAGEIEAALKGGLGYEVKTFLRDASEIRAIADYEPFPSEVVASSEGKLQVMLLERSPAKTARSKALAHSSEDDRLAIYERELYWLPSGGITDSALDLKAIAAAVGHATQRTKATIDLIAEKHFCD